MQRLLEKKISVKSDFQVRTHGYDLTKRWYVIYYLRIGDTKFLKKTYGGINRLKTIPERMRAAELLVERLSTNAYHHNTHTLIGHDMYAMLKEHAKDARDKTIVTYRTKVHRFVVYLNGLKITQWDQLQRLHLINWLASLNLGATTYNTHVMTITLFLKKAIKKGLWKGVLDEVPLRRENKQSKKLFKSNDIATLTPLLKQIPVQWLATQLLYYCFIRPGEMRLLHVNDINLDNESITVPGTISKNKKTQTVVIPKCFVPQLSNWIAGVPPTFFILNKDTKPVSRDFISKQHRIILNNAGYGSAYSFYSWKHTGLLMPHVVASISKICNCNYATIPWTK
jgi:integrase